jgi:phage gp45-like
MPIRSSPADSTGRAFGGLRRTTIEKINDDPYLQELDLNGLNEEKKTQVERVQEWGFSSVPMGPSDDQQGQQQQDGGGQAGGSASGGAGGKKAKKYAMAIIGYFAGSRSHGVILGVDDRRHRPRKLKEGESIQYDHQGQKFHLRNTGVEISGGDENLLQGEDKQPGGRNKKLPIRLWTGDGSHLIEKNKVTHAVKQTTHVIEDKKHTFVAGNATVTIEDGKITLDVDGTKVIVKPNRIDLGAEGGAKVLTVAGPAKKVYAEV